jgi:hypothetical protein
VPLSPTISGQPHVTPYEDAMSSPTSFHELPTVRHPVRWALVALGIVALLVVTATPADAHAEHGALPEGFEARITQVVDGAGDVAAPGPEFAVAADGARVTVSYRGDEELVVFGEQANEPLLRIIHGIATVNSASPQAVQVEGADVNPAAAAELIDLVWDRAPAVWEPVTTGATVSFMDHRAVPGHSPVRADYRAGDVAATWNIPFTVDGVEYSLTGEVVAAEVPGSGSGRALTVGLGGVLFGLLIAVFAIRGYRTVVGRRRRTVAAPSDDPTPGKELVGTR